MEWHRLNGERIEEPILDRVARTIRAEQEAGNRLKVCIGTDSSVRNGTVYFATVIVFLRVKKGGFMFIRSDTESREMSLRERMILEVVRSIEVAYALCPVLDSYGIAMEVHADINTDPHFQSNVALREAMGYIKGMGFAFRAKPEAFASSCCADKVV